MSQGGACEVVNPFHGDSSGPRIPSSANKTIELSVLRPESKSLDIGHAPQQDSHQEGSNTPGTNATLKACVGVVVAFSTVFLLVYAITWVSDSRGSLEDKASHAACVRLSLFHHLQYATVVGFFITNVFGRLRADEKKCRRVSGKVLWASLILFLGVVLVTVFVLEPPYSLCVSDHSACVLKASANWQQLPGRL